jgi:hypothetical protein
MRKTYFRVVVLAAAACGFAGAVRSAQAAFIITVQQSGTNVVMTGTGTINTAGLGSPTPYNNGASVYAPAAFLTGGPVTNTTCNQFSTGISGPTSFGSTGGFIDADSGSGNLVGIYGSKLYLPSGYVTNTALAFTDTYDNETISGLGLTPGTYTYSLGAGGNADSLTIGVSAVPEPASLSLLGIGGLTLLRRRARRGARG